MSRDDLDRLQSWHDRFSQLGIDAPLSHPACFKQALHIGEDAYKSLTIKRRSLRLLGPLAAAGAGAAVASSPVVATTFFSGGGMLGVILGWFGITTAATPIGWVIATAVLSGTAWAGIARMLDGLSSKRVDQIPRFINTPLDLLAISIFDLICPLAVKLAAVDGEIHEQERAEIARYFVATWGYDEEFVKIAIDMVSEYEDTFDDLVRDLVEFTRANQDCDAQAISRNVLAFLNDVAEASNGIGESERIALLETEKALTQHMDESTTIAAGVKRRLHFR